MPLEQMQRFSAAVFAGGRSTRMGADKAFLRIGNELLIERQLRILSETGAAELLISGRPCVEYSALDTRVIYDEYPDAGPLAGLAAILRAASFPIVLVLAVDMPEMTVAMLAKIVENCKEDQGCIPQTQQRFEPLAAAYPKCALPLAEQRLNAQNYFLQDFIKQAIADGLLTTLELQPKEETCFVNWNYLSDWSPTL